MNVLIQLISFAMCVSVTFGWGMPAVDDNNLSRKSMRNKQLHLLYPLYASSKRHNFSPYGTCLQAGESCFATKECCKHYVCAAFDELFGTDPKKPGYCVREKDLKPCDSHTDCDYRSACRKLAHNHQMYCVNDPSDMDVDEIKKLPTSSKVMKQKQKSQGGLGKSCSTSEDCQSHSKDGSRLCCQKVNRYRSGHRTLCDKVTLMSTCI